MYATDCVCATFYPLLCDLPCISREVGEYRDSSSLIFPLGHFDGWINNARMKARRLYHYIENNWVQSKLMITAAELSGSLKLELTLDLKSEKNGLLENYEKNCFIAL